MLSRVTAKNVGNVFLRHSVVRSRVCSLLLIYAKSSTYHDADNSLLEKLLNLALEGVITVRLHVMQRTVLQKPFCPSVRPSVKRVHCDKTKETCPHC